MKANLAMQIDSLNLQVEIDDQGKKTLIKKKQVERVVKIKKL